MGDALIENVISKYCVSFYIIMVQDSAFMSQLVNCLFKKFGIKIKTVAPYNQSIITGRTWNKIIVYTIDQTFNRSRSDMAKIFASRNSGI